MGKDRSHLARHMDTWTYELGAVGRQLIGVPHEKYPLDTTLPELEEMGMGLVQAMGDASDFAAEKPRAAHFAKIANQGMSDKIGNFAARGSHFCTPAGLVHTATPLYLARSSELQGVVAMREQLKALASWAHFCYDKGIKSGSMRTATPYMSFSFTPSFAKKDERGKKKIDSAEEVISSRAIARARYVPEIHYARVKNWKLLAPTIPVEKFHLMDSTWWWALSFSNLSQRYLRPPEDVLTHEQRARLKARKAKESLNKQ